MQATIIITRDVEARYRGLIASAMLEAAPGVYVAPRLSAGVRDRIWNTLSGWYAALGRGGLIMLYPDTSCPGGLAIRTLGDPPKEIVDADGILLAKRA